MILLTTDFGNGSPYIGQMKAAIHSINPTISVVDLYHDIQPQNIRQASWFLSKFVQPNADSIHICVVDPGVGTDREIICCKSNAGFFIGPDNGVFTAFLNDPTAETIVLDQPSFWNETVSSTFHGRDIMAPAAAHLFELENWSELGTPISSAFAIIDYHPKKTHSSIEGEVIWIDRFGNAISNICESDLATIPESKDCTFACGAAATDQLAKTYGDHSNDAMTLIGSGGWLEFATPGGNFSDEFDVRIGDRVTVCW